MLYILCVWQIIISKVTRVMHEQFKVFSINKNT